MVNNLMTKDEWKIQLIMTINFISSKDSGETRVMHSKSDNIEIMIGSKTRVMHSKSDNTEVMIGSETDKIIEELFKSLLQRYQKYL